MPVIPPLAPGASGEMVKALQHALIANGLSVGAAGADGNFNDETTAALEAFQDDAALTVQAHCDNACWAALYPAQKNEKDGLGRRDPLVHLLPKAGLLSVSGAQNRLFAQACSH